MWCTDKQQWDTCLSHNPLPWLPGGQFVIKGSREGGSGAASHKVESASLWDLAKKDNQLFNRV